MYLTITSQSFELRDSKYCVFMHVACISDNSHHCKRTVLSNKALANLHPQITQGSSQSISYVFGTTGKVSSPLLLQSLHHPFLLPSPSHKMPSFLQSPSPFPCAVDVRWDNRANSISSCSQLPSGPVLFLHVTGAEHEPFQGLQGTASVVAACNCNIGRVERWGKLQAGP